MCAVQQRGRRITAIEEQSSRDFLPSSSLSTPHVFFVPYPLWLSLSASLGGAQLQAGASVAVLARSRSKYDKLVPLLEERKLPVDKTTFISIDLSSTDAIRKATVEANEWAGGCADILVNNGESNHTTQPPRVQSNARIDHAAAQLRARTAGHR